MHACAHPRLCRVLWIKRSYLFAFFLVAFFLATFFFAVFFVFFAFFAILPLLVETTGDEPSTTTTHSNHYVRT